jgi:hypothetical protein
MSSSKFALITTMLLLSMGFVLVPYNSANAARYCAQLRGTTATGHELLILDAGRMSRPRKASRWRALLQIALGALALWKKV